MNTIDMAKPWQWHNNDSGWTFNTLEQIEAFRALIVAERDKELMGVGMEPAATVMRCVVDGEFIEGNNNELNQCFAPRKRLYTADQLAAAVVKEHHARELDARQYKARIAELEANLKRATAALKDAHEEVSMWGAYASKYYQNKHDLTGCLARIDEAITAAEKEIGK